MVGVGVGCWPITTPQRPEAIALSSCSEVYRDRVRLISAPWKTAHEQDCMCGWRLSHSKVRLQHIKGWTIGWMIRQWSTHVPSKGTLRVAYSAPGWWTAGGPPAQRCRGGPSRPGPAPEATVHRVPVEVRKLPDVQVVNVCAGSDGSSKPTRSSGACEHRQADIQAVYRANAIRNGASFFQFSAPGQRKRSSYSIGLELRVLNVNAL